MKNYFDALDRLCESGQPSKSEAISALQGKFPELSANAERAGRIVTAWRSGFGKTHVPQEGYASSEEAEALFLFGDFLRDLASNLACRNSAEKCALCVFTNTPACERMAPPCYNGVEQYLLKPPPIIRRWRCAAKLTSPIWTNFKNKVDIANMRRRMR